MIGDLVADVTAFSSLIGTTTLAFVAFSAWRDRRNTERHRSKEAAVSAALARSVAVTATKVAEVNGKLDTNTVLTKQTHDEVVSANGITGTELLERAEGRRIEEIPAHDRTGNEQGYVDRLEQGGRDK